MRGRSHGGVTSVKRSSSVPDSFAGRDSESQPAFLPEHDDAENQ